MRLLSIAAIMLLALDLTGCSVFMAAHEEASPDLTVLKVGTPRKTVEQVLTNRLTEGGARGEREVTYQFFTNDEKSVGRATVYGLLDIATLGLAELATTPIEALQGKKHLVTIVYDKSSRVQSVRHRVEEAALPKPERALGIEQDPATSAPVTAISDKRPPVAVLPEARARPL